VLQSTRSDQDGEGAMQKNLVCRSFYFRRNAQKLVRIIAGSCSNM
jgi:hypothetical protein